MKLKRILAASAACTVAAVGLSAQASAAGRLELLVKPCSELCDELGVENGELLSRNGNLYSIGTPGIEEGAGKESGSEPEDKPEKPVQPTEPETPEDNKPSEEVPAKGEDTESGADDKENPDTGAASAAVLIGLTTVAGGVLLLSRKRR